MNRRGEAAALATLAVGVAAVVAFRSDDAPAPVRAAAVAQPAGQPAPRWAYREAGAPVYFAGERFTGPDPVDASFGMRVEPYADLAVGDLFTVVLTIDNRGPATAPTSAQFWVGESLTVHVVDAGGGEVVKVDDHHAKLGYRVSGVEYRRSFPRGRTELRAVVRIEAVRCPGGGDFVAEVLGAFGRTFVSGVNNGDHLIWVDNDPPPGVTATCTSESVPNTAADRERARR